MQIFGEKNAKKCDFLCVLPSEVDILGACKGGRHNMSATYEHDNGRTTMRVKHREK